MEDGLLSSMIPTPLVLTYLGLNLKEDLRVKEGKKSGIYLMLPGLVQLIGVKIPYPQTVMFDGQWQLSELIIKIRSLS